MTSWRGIKDEQYATTYMMDEQLARDPRKARIDRLERELVRRHVADVPVGGRVVDAPAGNGRVTAELLRDDLEVIALDYDRSMLRAMDRRGFTHPRLFRAQADITALPLADDSVDLFLNFRLMHHIADAALQRRMYGEIARVLRGVLITTFWTTHCLRHVRKRLLGKKVRGHPVSPEHFRGVCADAGLVVVRIVSTRPLYEEECMAVCRPA